MQGLEQADLRGLSRGPVEATSAASLVPMPARRWKTRVLLPLGLLLAVASLLAYAARDAWIPAQDVRVVPVVVRTDAGAAAAVTVQAPGWLEADPFAVAVSALADGVVKEVLALEGQPIKADDVVARLVDDDARLALERAEADVAAAQAALATAEATHKAAQREWDNPVERTRKVSMTTAMLAERRAELDRWPSELAAEQARLAELEAEYERLKDLHEAKQASDIEFIRAREQWARQKAIVESTRGRKPVLDAQIEALKAEVHAAAEDLRLRIPETRAFEESAAAVAQAKAALRQAAAARDEARLRLDRMTVVSPVDGIVMTRLVAPGAKLMLNADTPTSATVLRLYDPAKLQVRADVPLADAALVGVGQEAEIVVDVLPDRVFTGHVTRIVHEADVQKNTLQVKVAVIEPSPELKPEMLARVRFIAAGKPDEHAAGRDVIFAPQKLVRTDADGRSVVCVEHGGLAERRAVTVGRARFKSWVEISDGLRAGDRLIVDDPARLSPEGRVRVIGEADSDEFD